jgi:NAD(P)-dependent dehydrogenase (short-subunit alcohol dehydrogenase family)
MNNVMASNSPAELIKDNSLHDKAVMVTGGASGLGAALCRVLAASGASIMVCDLDEAKAAAVAKSLGSHDVRVTSIGFDVADPQAAEQAVNEMVHTFGKIDVLVNNAGTDVTLSMAELPVSDWLRVINTNLNGPFLLAKYASEQMKQAGGGYIVNIASTAAKRAWPNASAYHASKWGLLGLSHAMHAELRPHNIKVTAVIAGGMRTPFLLDRFPDIDLATLQDPLNVAKTVKTVLLVPDETVIPEIMVLPMGETSWP